MEETIDGLSGWTKTPSNASFDGDDNDGEDHHVTSPLHSEAAYIPGVNGNSEVNSASKHYVDHPVERNWLTRFLHIASRQR
jgi:hypothetical protein